jgi:1,4-alpha-glucan branching enzyme
MQPSPADLVTKLLASDPYLKPYENALLRRIQKTHETEAWLTQGEMSLEDFASGHEYFGLHFKNNQWIFREWAPNATAIYIIGDITDWQEKKAFALERINDQGVWEIRLDSETMDHGDLYRLRMHWSGGSGDRIPAYARRVVQDADTLIFNAQVWRPTVPYQWQHPDFRRRDEAVLVYEAHVGMAQDAAKVGTYREFLDNIIPRIVASGYNTLQLMAIPEHPYYGSFGYHVSSFFAASSRFGTPEDFKALIDNAHAAGVAVIIDIVHSHAVSNQVEGLSHFDGTPHLYFHDGPRGDHVAWDSRCFDYGKLPVIHFLLSNCRYWLDEFKVDGFRFDGITSMLYTHHGLGTAFTSYADYFNENVDEDALIYLTLANKVVHAVRSDAITIAEDISGMPGLALPASDGGCGFDYRFAMGVPDYWIKLLKDTRDDEWHMGGLWHELTNRREEEKTISYAESHDQALVGDKTIIFRLIDAEMYEHMSIDDDNLTVDRGLALHKMIRLITLATAANGYLNFMGNEFGHPEWIDFPRQGNDWSYHHARRQWRLVDDSHLKYRFLYDFDKAMLRLVRKAKLLEHSNIRLLSEHSGDKTIVFERAGLVFAFNFHPTQSYSDYPIMVEDGRYQMILDSDAVEFGGHERLVPNQEHITQTNALHSAGRPSLHIYMPNRTGIVLQPIPKDCP